MKLTITAVELKKLKTMSRGNSQKIAEYKIKERAYNELVEALFDEDTQFVDNPSEQYVRELAEKAESGDEVDEARYAVMKDRFDMYEYEHKQAHFDYVKTRSSLMKKISSGEQLTKSDLSSAELLARQHSSIDNIVLYSKIKHELAQEASE
ncbi:hypothetical protein [Aneurinibacillus sp. REN35]|uniref:hypothetical protein n=1 Tax=Aneurinibacillus sp. REN35 TaxID=3237286 RepID=UPI003527F13A